MVQAEVTSNQRNVKLSYPKSIPFIISNEFCERFNYYGMRTILALYLTRKLEYNDDTATVLFHAFAMLVYFFPLFGAILADSWLGKFNTIFYLSIIYAIGSIIISVGAIPNLGLPVEAITILGLLLIAIGTGGIKPCVSAFGGDQFKIPEQAKQLATFFSLFYFAINAGSLLSTSITPILREDVHCFNENGCFSLAFGVPGLLMIVAIVIFVFGKKLYIIKKPSGNMILLVSKCITKALVVRSKDKKSNPKEHWLDYAEAKYGRSLVNDVKALLKILVLYLPLPVFWALFDQQGSRWTFQATRMTGNIGEFTIKPDQMQVVNPLMILAFIPIFEYGIYPMLSKIGIRRPLQKLTIGGLLAGLAFVIAGFVELDLEKTYPVVPGVGESQLRIFNGMPCEYKIYINEEEHMINETELFQKNYSEMLKPLMAVPYRIESTDPTICPTKNGIIELMSGEASSYIIRKSLDGVNIFHYKDSVDKSSSGSPVIRLLVSARQNYTIVFRDADNARIEFLSNSTEKRELETGQYDIYINDVKLFTTDLKLGGGYTFVIAEVSSNKFMIRRHIVVQPNSIHMLWLLPQYVVITAAEVMFSVTGLEFSYSQAPDSMKSVLQACWLLTVAFGNLIVVVIAELRFFESQAAEFFLFAGLMIIDVGIFIILAMLYKYAETSVDDENRMVENLSKLNNENDIYKKNSNIDIESVVNGETNQAYQKD